MTPEKQRSILAGIFPTVCSARGFVWDCSGFLVHPLTQQTLDPLEDRNVIHEMVDKLDHLQYQTYFRHLQAMTASGTYHHGSVAWNRLVYQATPAQCVEALLRTFNKQTP
jgi:hypothetical protein